MVGLFAFFYGSVHLLIFIVFDRLATLNFPNPLALKTFGLLPGAMRGLPFDRRVEALLAGRDDMASIARPMLVA